MTTEVKATRTTKARTVLAEKEVEEVKPTKANAPTRARKRSSSSLRTDTENTENEVPVEEAEVEPRVEVEIKKATVELLGQEPKTKKICVTPPPVGDYYKDIVQEFEEDDRNDPLMVAEYANDIDAYLRELEEKSTLNPDYMDFQDELQWKMRGILVDWLVEVHTRFRLLPETLYLTVNIIDRFLGYKQVGLDKLQLVGVAAMWIASKYEEVYSPSIKNFIYVSDGGYTEDEILRAERFILATINFDLSYPNPMNFLRRVSKADDYDIRTRTFAKYLMEVSLLDHRFLPFRGSLVAATAMYMARKMYSRGPWVSRSFCSPYFIQFI